MIVYVAPWYALRLGLGLGVEMGFGLGLGLGLGPGFRFGLGLGCNTALLEDGGGGGVGHRVEAERAADGGRGDGRDLGAAVPRRAGERECPLVTTPSKGLPAPAAAGVPTVGSPISRGGERSHDRGDVARVERREARVRRQRQSERARALRIARPEQQVGRVEEGA